MGRASIFAVGTNVVQVLGGFLAAVMMARLLGPAQKGAYDLYAASSVLLSVLLGFALNAGVTYVVASQAVHTWRLLRVLTVIAAGESCLAMGVVWFAGRLGSVKSIVPSELGVWGVPMIAGAVFWLSAATFYRAVLVGHREFIAANRGDVAKQAAGIGLIGMAIVLAKAGYVSALPAVILANMAAIALSTASYGLQMPVTQETTTDIGLSRAWRFSLPSYLANASQYLNNRIDLFFIYRYWGAAHVGIYQTSVLIGQSINLLPGAVQGILFPTIASGRLSASEVILTVTRTHRLVFSLGALMAVAAAVSGFAVIPLLFGKRFAESSVSLAVLAPGCAVYVTTNILAAYFAGTGRPHINFINSLIQAVMTITLDSVVVPRWGFYGASAVWSASCAVSSMCCLFVFCRETKVRLLELYVLQKPDLQLGNQYYRMFAARLGRGKI